MLHSLDVVFFHFLLLVALTRCCVFSFSDGSRFTLIIFNIPCEFYWKTFSVELSRSSKLIALKSSISKHLIEQMSAWTTHCMKEVFMIESFYFIRSCFHKVIKLPGNKIISSLKFFVYSWRVDFALNTKGCSWQFLSNYHSDLRPKTL